MSSTEFWYRVALTGAAGVLFGASPLGSGADKAVRRLATISQKRGHQLGKLGIKRAPMAGRFLGRGARLGLSGLHRARVGPIALRAAGGFAVTGAAFSIARGGRQIFKEPFEGSTRVESVIGVTQADFVDRLTLGLLPADIARNPAETSRRLTESRRDFGILSQTTGLLKKLGSGGRLGTRAGR